jgi:hypothetical protein
MNIKAMEELLEKMGHDRAFTAAAELEFLRNLFGAVQVLDGYAQKDHTRLCAVEGKLRSMAFPGEAEKPEVKS